MNTTEKALLALDKLFERIPKEEMSRIIDEIDNLGKNNVKKKKALRSFFIILFQLQ